MPKKQVAPEPTSSESPTASAGSDASSRIKQTDVPSISVEQATKLAKAIGDHYAYKATTPLRLAQALGVQPNSGGFRMLCGASSAFGFTKGSWNSTEITLEQLGLKFVRPLVEGEDVKALREALLKPRIIGEFLRQYHNSPVPREDIACNVLTDMGVPKDRAKSVFEQILEGAERTGYLRTINGKRYVDLDVMASSQPSGVPSDEMSGEEPEEVVAGIEVVPDFSNPQLSGRDTLTATPPQPAVATRRVFITHGKNRSLVDLIKRFLAYAEMEPVVLVDQQTVAQPIPEKVLEGMRSCSAAVIHVDAESTLIDAEGKEQPILNPNVLIEVGAAMALYGRRFILLVKQGVVLPSNLQGLYEVRYEGDTLDGQAVMKLLEALADLKKRPLPTSTILY